jgi:hypothetical protein
VITSLQSGRWMTVGARHNEKNKAFHAATRDESFVCIGPNGAFRYVSRPPLGGFSKPRPMAVVGYSLHRLVSNNRPAMSTNLSAASGSNHAIHGQRVPAARMLRNDRRGLARASE